MRRYVQILGLIVLAFAASGWGSILAAALCPHARLSPASASATESVTEERACHNVKPEVAAKPDCHDDSMMNHETAAAEAEPSNAMPEVIGENAALSLPENLPCTHCLGRPELPSSNVIARTQANERRVDETVPLSTTPLQTPSFSFPGPVLYRQGAPPGSAKSKHLLISVLLI